MPPASASKPDVSYEPADLEYKSTNLQSMFDLSRDTEGKHVGREQHSYLAAVARLTPWVLSFANR